MGHVGHLLWRPFHPVSSLVDQMGRGTRGSHLRCTLSITVEQEVVCALSNVDIADDLV